MLRRCNTQADHGPVDLLVRLRGLRNPAADDGELWWARTLARYGLTGCFCVVGELARALLARGRRDVLEAYAAHEIAFHSDMHSAHPTHAEYLEALEWDAGMERLLREEGRGVADVREILGRQPTAYCKPGNSWGPQVAAALPRLGVPLLCDAPLEWSPGRPMWYSGSLCLKYHHHFDGYFDMPADAAGSRLQRMKEDLVRLLEAHGDGYVVMYTHPCRLYTAAFPDNFTGGKNPPRTHWRPAPLRPEPEREALKADFEAFLKWVARELRPEMTTYGEVWRRHAPGPARWLNREAVRNLAARLPAAPEPLEWGDGTLSAVEQWSVLVGALALGEVHLTWPRQVATRRLLGPVESPPALAEPVEVPVGLLMAAARRALRYAEETGRLPASIPLERAAVGPNALLQACARAIPRHFRGRWRERVTVAPADEMPALAHREDFQRLRYAGSWSIFPPEFEGRRLLELARLQAWSAAPA
jgi:hypothetical protein